MEEDIGTGGGSGTTQAVSENELELAKAAKEAFDSHRYENCLSNLNKLLDARRNDPRVAHNRAVAQYLLSNMTMTDEFRKSLQAVNAQFDKEAEGSDVESSAGDKGVVLFNQALLHVRLHQNSQAMEILEQLQSVSNRLGDLSVEVCLLYIDVCISTYQLGKAAALLEDLDRKFSAEQDEHHPSQEGAGGGGNNGPPQDVGSGGGGGLRGPVRQRYLPQIHQLKGRLHIQHRNLGACKKEVKALASIAGNTPCAQYLRANIEYLKLHHTKALRVLASAPRSPMVTDAGECLSSFYFNDLGCIYHCLGKHSGAAHYFCKAIEENDAALNGFPPLDRATPLSGRPLSVLGVNCRHVLLYNLGLQQLFAGYPLAAFDSLMEVVQVYHTSPQLWLRLAEACIAADSNKPQQSKLSLLTYDSVAQSDVVSGAFGRGLHRKLLASPIQQRQAKNSSVDGHTQSSAMPAPVLEFASICLRNALFLLPPLSSSSSSSSSPSPPLVSALPGPPLQGDAITNLRCSVLACLAYVSLGLGDPVSTLSYSQELLKLPKLSGGLKFLAQMYASEALVYLGRTEEAFQYLNPDSILDIATSPPTSASLQTESLQSEHVSKPLNCGFPSSVNAAKATTLVNLTSVFCLKGELEKARRTLQQALPLFGSQVPGEAVLLSSYIDLMSGNISAALLTLKRLQPFSSPMEKPQRSRYLFERVTTHT